MSNPVLVTCPSCNRTNNLQRATCIYCGTSLPIIEGRELERLPTLRPLEEYELGFNLILLSRNISLKKLDQRKIENITGLDFEHFTKLISANISIPIARVATLQDANIIYQQLLAMEIHTEIFSDEKFCLKTLPNRIRQIKFLPDNCFELIGNNQTVLAKVPTNSIKIILDASINFRYIAVTEENQRRVGGNFEIKDVNEYPIEKFVLDFFGEGIEQHFRIFAESFDYTCLEKQKSLLAIENFQKLKEWIFTRAPQAILDKNFRTVTHFLVPIWPRIKHTEKRSLKHNGIGKFTNESLYITNNEEQFTRYARLQYICLDKK